MYQLKNEIVNGEVLGQSVIKQNADGSTTSFAQDPANSDFANFKKEILADEAQLQDADGLTLSAAEAKTYVSSLP